MRLLFNCTIELSFIDNTNTGRQNSKPIVDRLIPVKPLLQSTSIRITRVFSGLAYSVPSTTNREKENAYN